jgi:hypothetical protein
VFFTCGSRWLLPGGLREPMKETVSYTFSPFSEPS